MLMTSGERDVDPSIVAVEKFFHMGLRKQPFNRRSSDIDIFKQDNSYTTNELDLYLKRKENSE